MRHVLHWIIERLRPRWPARIDVAAARPLGNLVTVYVVDVDGRRSVFAVGPSAMCVLARYAVPHGAAETEAGPTSVLV